MSGYDYEAVLKKWNIDAKEYEPWIPAANLCRLFDEYKKQNGLKTDALLADAIKIQKQQVSYFRKKARNNEYVMMVRAIAIVARFGIDPRFLLVEKKKSPEIKLDTLDMLFLDTFSGDTLRAAMIKYKVEIMNCVRNLTEQNRKADTEKLKKVLGLTE